MRDYWPKSVPRVEIASKHNPIDKGAFPENLVGVEIFPDAISLK
jgi:hypothetical protein